MFQYTPENEKSLRKALSDERLSTYLKATNGDFQKALALYVKNIEVSAAFLLPLQGLEISLRNAINTTISAHYATDDWFDTIPLDAAGKIIIEKAKSKLTDEKKDLDNSRIVAEISFGFWVTLLSRKYHQTLWEPFLHNTFPHAKKPRRKIHGCLFNLSKLRNRIAHHEPIFHRHLEKDYASILEALGWVCPDMADWIKAHNSTLETIKQTKKILFAESDT